MNWLQPKSQKSVKQMQPAMAKPTIMLSRYFFCWIEPMTLPMEGKRVAKDPRAPLDSSSSLRCDHRADLTCREQKLPLGSATLTCRCEW